MTNCLSDSSFENLLFVHVRIQEAESIALFDTGAGITVISRSLLARLGITAENAAFRAGNNNGLLRTLQTAVLSHVRIGDICVETLRVLVTGDADFALSDSSGAAFPAEMLLGWDVIARYRWRYSAKDGTLSVSASERDGAPADPDSKQVRSQSRQRKEKTWNRRLLRSSAYRRRTPPHCCVSEDHR